MTSPTKASASRPGAYGGSATSARRAARAAGVSMAWSRAKFRQTPARSVGPVGAAARNAKRSRSRCSVPSRRAVQQELLDRPGVQQGLIEAVQPQLEDVVAVAPAQPRLMLEERGVEQSRVVKGAEVNATYVDSVTGITGCARDLILDCARLAEAGLGEKHQAPLSATVHQPQGGNPRDEQARPAGVGEETRVAVEVRRAREHPEPRPVVAAASSRCHRMSVGAATAVFGAPLRALRKRVRHRTGPCQRVRAAALRAQRDPTVRRAPLRRDGARADNQEPRGPSATHARWASRTQRLPLVRRSRSGSPWYAACGPALRKECRGVSGLLLLALMLGAVLRWSGANAARQSAISVDRFSQR